MGRLQKVNDDGSKADALYTYNSVGALETTSYRNDLITTYAYNSRNWLRRLRTTRSGSLVANFDYDGAGQTATLAAPGAWGDRGLSPTGLRRRVDETFNGTSRTVNYDYDSLHRLTQEAMVSGTPVATVSYGATGGGMGYDPVGNRRSRQVTVGTLSAVTDYSGHSFDERDLLNPGSGFTYDANGNTTAEAAGATYLYDAENRLVSRTGGGLPTIELAYDADGNRVRKSVTPVGSGNAAVTSYLVEDRNPTGYAQVMEERDASDATTVTYVYGLDLISQKRGGTVYYYGYDGLGSVRYLANTSGNVTDTYIYDAFGILINQWPSTGQTKNSYRYTGEQWDEDLWMYYLRARYYHPQIGRFWTMDTYEGQNEDPLSLHKYLYCHGDPVNYTDPTGHAENLGSMLVNMSIKIGLFTAQWAAKHPKTAFVVVSALSATGIFDGFPPGHPTPFDELATFGRVIRGTGSVVKDTVAVARYQGALSVKAFFSKFWRQDYRKTFFQVFPDLKGKVWVHHAVEQQVLTKYPGVVTEAELNSLANLRGIPNEINSEIHLSKIRMLWDDFYASHPTATKEQLLEYAKKIDDLFGSLFDPPIRQ